jgi:hypothetical protein
MGSESTLEFAQPWTGSPFPNSRRMPHTILAFGLALLPVFGFWGCVTADEAVAVALWNNAAFQASLNDLGFARADLAEAGLLANPVLSLLLPVGPKQLEATLRWPQAPLIW